MARGDGAPVLIGAFLAMLLLAPSGGASALRGMEFAQVVVREQIRIRVQGVRVPPKVEWKERRGPRCIEAGAIAGAAVLGPRSVDVVLRDNSRLRVKLDSSCPALDFYRGFYLRPTEDGRICAERDVIRSRMGGQCGIDAFRRLEPVPRD